HIRLTAARYWRGRSQPPPREGRPATLAVCSFTAMAQRRGKRRSRSGGCWKSCMGDLYRAAWAFRGGRFEWRAGGAHLGVAEVAARVLEPEVARELLGAHAGVAVADGEVAARRAAALHGARVLLQAGHQRVAGVV